MSLVNLLRKKKDYKEYNEVKAFVDVIANYFDFSNKPRIADLCCGNGMLGFHLLEQNLVDEVLFVDKYKSRQFQDLDKTYSSNSNNYTFLEKEISMLEPIPSEIFLSIHACNTLTDKIMQLSLEQEKPFAVMTCCHQRSLLKKYKELIPNHLLFSLGLSTYLDLARAKKVRSSNRKCFIRTINRNITKSNNIIISVNQY